MPINLLRPGSSPDPSYAFVTLQQAAELSAVNIGRIRQAIGDRELRPCEFEQRQKRVSLSELHNWWLCCQAKMRPVAADYLKEAAARARKAKKDR
jgi:hypothetical protein